LLIFGGVVLFLVYLGWDLLSGMTASRPQRVASVASVGETPLQPTAAPPLVDPAIGRPHQSSVTYAMDIKDVAGLAPNAQPGALLDLWVTWDRPVSEVPRLQRMLRGVVLEQVAPPVTPDGPYVAILSVPRRDVDKLLWADRYGAVSATTIPAY